MQSFAFYKDSTQMALLGLYDKYHLDVSLMIAERDTLKESKRYENWKDDKVKAARCLEEWGIDRETVTKYAEGL